ncbi:MAG: hypothetical protein ABIO73_17490, partial [Polaromonas sp.]
MLLTARIRTRDEKVFFIFYLFIAKKIGKRSVNGRSGDFNWRKTDDPLGWRSKTCPCGSLNLAIKKLQINKRFYEHKWIFPGVRMTHDACPCSDTKRPGAPFDGCQVLAFAVSAAWNEWRCGASSLSGLGRFAADDSQVRQAASLTVSQIQLLSDRMAMRAVSQGADELNAQHNAQRGDRVRYMALGAPGFPGV